MDDKKLISDIKEAFDATLKPDKLFVETAPHYFDAESASNDLNYTYWYEVPLQEIIKHRNQFAYLNADGFHFLLPALMIAIIEHPYEVDTLDTSIIVALTPPKDSASIWDIFLDRVSRFSKKEAVVIADFLEMYPSLYSVDMLENTSTGKYLLLAQIHWNEKAESLS